MKKLHFSSMAILFALFTMVSFTACSSDDDETPSTEDIKTNIIGKWQLTHVSGWQYDNTEDDLIKVDQDIPEKQGKRLLFKGDGTYKKYWYSGISGWYSPGYTCNKYEVSGNKIITLKPTLSRKYTSNSLPPLIFHMVLLHDPFCPNGH